MSFFEPNELSQPFPPINFASYSHSLTLLEFLARPDIIISLAQMLTWMLWANISSQFPDLLKPKKCFFHSTQSTYTYQISHWNAKYDYNLLLKKNNSFISPSQISRTHVLSYPLPPPPQLYSYNMKITEVKYFWVEVQILEKSAVASHGLETLRLFRKNGSIPWFLSNEWKRIFPPTFPMCAQWGRHKYRSVSE